MRVLRVGRQGSEKPVIAYEGELRDVSVYVSEIDRAFLNAEWRCSLQALGRETMPWVDPAARRGACLEHVGRLIRTGPMTRDAPDGVSATVDLRGGGAAGANDPIMLPPLQARFECKGGLALVLRAWRGTVTISGVSLYLDVSVMSGPAMPDGASAVASSADTLFSLGPYLVDLAEWAESRSGLMEISLNGRVVATAPDAADVGSLRARVAGIETLLRPATADIVLVDIFSAPPIVALATGDTVKIACPYLGQQERVCVA